MYVNSNLHVALVFECILYVHSVVMNMHRRRNRGGQWGHLPPQAAGRGGNAPTTKAMPGCCTRPDYDSFHEYRQLQSILYLTYSLFLHCYNQETLVYLCQAQTLASLMQKWVWFLRNVGVVQIFSHAMRAINILCPHNVQHLPTPLTCHVYTHIYVNIYINTFNW